MPGLEDILEISQWELLESYPVEDYDLILVEVFEIMIQLNILTNGNNSISKLILILYCIWQSWYLLWRSRQRLHSFVVFPRAWCLSSDLTETWIFWQWNYLGVIAHLSSWNLIKSCQRWRIRRSRLVSSYTVLLSLWFLNTSSSSTGPGHTFDSAPIPLWHKPKILDPLTLYGLPFDSALPAESHQLFYANLSFLNNNNN